MRPIALVVLVPLATFAQTSPPEAVAATPAPVALAAPSSPAPAWSIGAGISFQTVNDLPPVSISGVVFLIPDVPTASASLERRLSARSWLVLGVNGSFIHHRQDVTAGSTGLKKYDLYELALAAGVRYVVTPAAAPVDVSVLALAEAGATRWKGDEVHYELGTSTTAEASFDRSGWRAGASLELAVDRELTRNLSLRLATPLVGAWYDATRTSTSGEPTVDASAFAAHVDIAPRLELRLAF